MLNLEKTKVGSRVSINLVGVPKMNKKGNDLYGRVTRNHLISDNIAGEKSYEDMLERDGKRAKGGVPWFVRAFPNKWPWIVTHRTKGGLYLRVIRPSVIRREYLVDGRIATSNELAIIEAFKVNSGDSFHTYKLENCANAD